MPNRADRVLDPCAYRRNDPQLSGSVRTLGKRDEPPRPDQGAVELTLAPWEILFWAKAAGGIATNVDKLLRIASAALNESTPLLTEEYSALAGALAQELLALLCARNGFYAFESALHVRPVSDLIGELGIEEWNAPALWRSSYRGLADDLLFFTEDIFGGQFGIEDSAVHRFGCEFSKFCRAFSLNSVAPGP